jgi:YHS domain-containing protein
VQAFGVSTDIAYIIFGVLAWRRPTALFTEVIMIRIRVINLAILSILAGGIQANAGDERIFPKDIKILSEDELHANIVGGQVSAIFKINGTDVESIEYFEPNGRIHGLFGSESFRAEWSISGNWFCEDYYIDKFDQCYTLELIPDGLTMYGQNGKPRPQLFKLLSKNEFTPPTIIKRPVNIEFFSQTAIGGFDPVAYFTVGQPTKGQADYSHEWLGATWQFMSDENRQLFIKNPIQFAPQYGGYCSQGVVDGLATAANPRAWKIVDGKLFLFAEQRLVTHWEEDYKSLTHQANAQWPKVLAELKKPEQ